MLMRNRIIHFIQVLQKSRTFETVGFSKNVRSLALSDEGMELSSLKHPLDVEESMVASWMAMNQQNETLKFKVCKGDSCILQT